MAEEEQGILVEIKGTCKKMGILWSCYGLTIKYSFPKNVRVINNFAYMYTVVGSGSVVF